LESWVIPTLEWLYSEVGYLGVMIAMALESACIPIPSEIILPMAGWMVAQSYLQEPLTKVSWDLWLAVIAGTVGNTMGSVLAYAIGAFGGRPFLERYGRYLLISRHELETADRWFARYGNSVVFFSRLLPVIRTFISLPAGIAKMDLGKFIIYSTLGALPWSIALVWLGKWLGDNWLLVRRTLGRFDVLILALIILFAILFFYRRFMLIRKY